MWFLSFFSCEEITNIIFLIFSFYLLEAPPNPFQSMKAIYLARYLDKDSLLDITNKVFRIVPNFPESNLLLKLAELMGCKTLC